MLDRSIHHFLTLPNKAAWDALVAKIGWEVQGDFVIGPLGQTAYVFGPNYFLHEDGTREPREGFLVNTEGQLPEEMAVYALPERPQYPKAVMLGDK
jgi:hypothetical protein